MTIEERKLTPAGQGNLQQIKLGIPVVEALNRMEGSSIHATKLEIAGKTVYLPCVVSEGNMALRIFIP